MPSTNDEKILLFIIIITDMRAASCKHSLLSVMWLSTYVHIFEAKYLGN